MRQQRATGLHATKGRLALPQTQQLAHRFRRVAAGRFLLIAVAHRRIARQQQQRQRRSLRLSPVLLLQLLTPVHQGRRMQAQLPAKVRHKRRSDGGRRRQLRNGSCRPVQLLVELVQQAGALGQLGGRRIRTAIGGAQRQEQLPLGGGDG